VVLAALRPGRLSAALSQRHLVALGRLSYSLYLWHYPVKLAAVHVADSIAVSTTVARLAGLAVSVGAAAASYRFVEQPLRRRWATARPRPLTVPATIAAASR
jgi:peptidoglycan/LPS O-acetylase OafA/YrhL